MKCVAPASRLGISNENRLRKEKRKRTKQKFRDRANVGVYNPTFTCGGNVDDNKPTSYRGEGQDR